MNLEAMWLERPELLEGTRKFLAEFLAVAKLDLKFELELAEARVNVSLAGKDVDLILANSARALYAINHLLNQVFYRRSKDRLNFWVDCNDYRATRALELQLLAKKAAEQIGRTGRPFALQPMPASERRIIHLALKENPRVRTMSEGFGLNRRVVILPAS